jgi:hypothetical protein
MADETKITLKMGLIASAVAAALVMMFGALWNYQARLVVLETNYGHMCNTITEFKQEQFTIARTVQEIRDNQLRLQKKE